MKKVFGLLTVGAVSVALAGCGSDYNYSEAEFRYATTAAPDDLNTAVTSMATNFQVLNNIGEGLVRLGEDDQPMVTTSDGGINYQVVDGLAKSILKGEDSEGHITWTFTLRDNIKWSNGDTLDAYDFEFGFRQLVNPANAGGYSSLADIIVNGAEIRGAGEGKKENELYGQLDALGAKATNATTFVVTLNEEVPYFLSLMGFPSFQPIHKETWDAAGGVGGRYGKTAQYTISSGPFKLVDFQSDYGVYLVKNENYWDAEHVSLESISYKKIAEQTTQLADYGNGKLDFISLTADAYESAQSKHSSELELNETSTIYYLISNLNSPYMADYRVREALYNGLNIQSAAATMPPYVTTNTFVPSGLAIHNGIDYADSEPLDKYDVPARNVDLTKANSLISDTGKTYNDLEFMAFNSEGWVDMLNNITNSLSAIEGVTANQNLLKPSDVYAKYDENVGFLTDAAGTNPVGTWDIGWYGWGPDYPDPTTYLDLFYSQNSHNSIGLDQYGEGNYDRVIGANGEKVSDLSKIYDGYLDAANIALQSGDYATYYNQLAHAEAFLIDNYFIYPVAQKATGILTKPNVSGVWTHQFGADYTWKYVTVS